MVETSYRDDVRVDRYNLPNLLETHGELYVKWGERWVMANDKRDRAEANLKLVKDDAKEAIARERARLDLAIRKTPSDYGIEKATDNPVANAILCSEEYQAVVDEWNQRIKDATKEFLDAERDANMMKIAKEGMGQRQFDNLTRLHADGMWNHKVPRRAINTISSEETKEVNEETKEVLKDAMSRRKRRLLGKE